MTAVRYVALYLLIALLWGLFNTAMAAWRPRWKPRSTMMTSEEQEFMRDLLTGRLPLWETVESMVAIVLGGSMWPVLIPLTLFALLFAAIS